MDSKQKKTESTNLFKNSLIMIIGVAVSGVGLWALMFYSAPPSKLEPYETYKKSQKNSETEAKKQNPTPTQDIEKVLEKASTTKNNLKNLVKTATSTPSPKSKLSRKTLEHVQKGMELTEKGKYNAGNIELENSILLLHIIK